jgi:phytoene dehydrogenase-like protein
MPALPPALVSLAAQRRSTSVGLPHATAVKNLYLVGRENLPGLGLEGELISGWGAARLVSAGRRASTCRPADADRRVMKRAR